MTNYHIVTLDRHLLQIKAYGDYPLYILSSNDAYAEAELLADLPDSDFLKKNNQLFYKEIEIENIGVFETKWIAVGNHSHASYLMGSDETEIVKEIINRKELRRWINQKNEVLK